jgi:hypothetical protein
LILAGQELCRPPAMAVTNGYRHLHKTKDKAWQFFLLVPMKFLIKTL